MERRDYFKREIDQLGKVLGKLLADLLGTKGYGSIGEEIESTQRALKNELDIDIEELMKLPEEKFINVLKDDRKFSNENLNQLADMLLLMADKMSEEQDKSDKRRSLYEKSLLIYQYLEKSEATYSYERHMRIEKIKKLI